MIHSHSYSDVREEVVKSGVAWVIGRVSSEQILLVFRRQGIRVVNLGSATPLTLDGWPIIAPSAHPYGKKFDQRLSVQQTPVFQAHLFQSFFNVRYSLTKRCLPPLTRPAFKMLGQPAQCREILLNAWKFRRSQRGWATELLWRVNQRSEMIAQSVRSVKILARRTERAPGLGPDARQLLIVLGDLELRETKSSKALA